MGYMEKRISCYICGSAKSITADEEEGFDYGKWRKIDVKIDDEKRVRFVCDTCIQIIKTLVKGWIPKQTRKRKSKGSKK